MSNRLKRPAAKFVINPNLDFRVESSTPSGAALPPQSLAQILADASRAADEKDRTIRALSAQLAVEKGRADKAEATLRKVRNAAATE